MNKIIFCGKEFDLDVQLYKIINFDEIKNKSMIILKFAKEDIDINKKCLEKIVNMCRSCGLINYDNQNLFFVVIDINQSVEICDEKTMNSLGWYKK